jgi:hypothetical protein
VSVEAALALLRYAESGGDKREWPLPAERRKLTLLNTWAAIRESDREQLRRASNWTDATRAYRVDPLGEVIAERWAAYLFGEEPVVTPKAAADETNMAAMLGENDFGAELERGAGLCVSEGEIWPRIYVDPLVSDYPLLEWVSRRSVLPLWVGPRLAAAAVWTELPPKPNQAKGSVYRHFEVHAPGVIVNALYAGSADKLGEQQDLASHPQTADLDEVWEHNLPGMMLARITNKIRADRRLGVSEYAGIHDFLLDLNEAATIGHSNMVLTARKRVVVSSKYLTRRDNSFEDVDSSNGPPIDAPKPKFAADEEVFVEDALDTELGKAASDPVRVVEYSFDAAPLIEWKRELVETAITRSGMNAQYVGTDSRDGYAISGTALRLRLIPTDSVGRKKARAWMSVLPRLLAMLAQVDALEVGDIAGRRWTDAAGIPTIVRRPGIPVDQTEEATRHATLVGAGLESRYTAVRDLHPDWPEKEVLDEVKRIGDEQPAAPAGSLPFGP